MYISAASVISIQMTGMQRRTVLYSQRIFPVKHYRQGIQPFDVCHVLNRSGALVGDLSREVVCLT